MHQKENDPKFVNLFALVFPGRLFYVCIKKKELKKHCIKLVMR